jgi:hypothetical protein
MSAGDEPHSRAPLIILLVVDLLCLLVLAALAVYLNVQAGLAGAGIVIVSVVETVLYIFGLIAVCVGLAGTSRKDTRALLCYFVCGILYLVACFFLKIVSLAIANQGTYGGVGQAFFQGFTAIVPFFTLPVLTGSAVTLAFRGYQQLRHPSETPRDTSYRNSMLGSFISCAIISLYFVVVYWFTPSNLDTSSFVTMGIILVVPMGFNLVAVILGLVAASGCVSPRDQRNLLLAFFIMELLYMLSIFGLYIWTVWAGALGWMLGLYTVAGLIDSYFVGSALTLAWLHRKSLLGGVEYYALNDDVHHH